MLEDGGFDIINDSVGGLASNLSEFRETGNYYFFVLYAAYLVKTKIIRS